MKFLISGLGSIGRRHFRNLVALGETHITLHRTHLATLSDDELAGYPVETDLAAALAQHPDAVFITNPTALHMEVAIPAAEAGCHIFLEKPISHTLEGLDRLQAAVQKNNRQVLVGFQFRYHPGLRQVKAWLEMDAIGTPISARAHWGEYLPNWHPWEDYKQGYAARPDLGGGVVRTLTHPLDYLRWLLGEVSAVWAFTSSTGLNMPVEDNAEIGLRFANGALGSVHLDYNQQPPTHTLELTGTQGHILWDNADGSARLYRHDHQAESYGPYYPTQFAEYTLSADWLVVHPPAGFERNWMFVEQTRHFLSVLRGEAQPVCGLQDGTQALRLALSALESSQRGALITL